MTMLGTIYSGTTGLVTYSRGLDVISNNAANLNTAGFKRSDLLFRDLFYEYSSFAESEQNFQLRKDGNGVGNGGTLTSFSQGDIQQTGNDTDVAIDGNGFFILRDEGQVLYTRVGQFEIDEDNFLVSAINGARVASVDDAGNLQDINITDLRSNPATPTAEVDFVNNLSTGSTEHVIEDIEIIDALGDTHLLTLTLRNNSSETPRSWLAEITDEEDNTIASDLEIRFQGDGSPEEEFNAVTFTFSPEEIDPQDIRFFFGEPGTFTNATSFSAGSSSDLAVGSQDGIAFGAQTNLTFNQDGVLEVEYSNGENAEGERLALAWVNDLQSLRQLGNGLFRYDNFDDIEISAANEGVMGEIVASSVEISNVELSQEFTDLVIVQRGFQVSSQVVSVVNEMMEQLIQASDSRR